MKNHNDLFGPPQQSDVTLDRKVKELTRELGYRRHVYGRLVRNGRMKQQEAEERILIMEAILADYQSLETVPRRFYQVDVPADFEARVARVVVEGGIARLEAAPGS